MQNQLGERHFMTVYAFENTLQMCYMSINKCNPTEWAKVGSRWLSDESIAISFIENT